MGPTFFKLTATFFLAASAGLMVLSQAREIVAARGSTLRIEAEGPDERQAVDALRELIGSGFGEE